MTKEFEALFSIETILKNFSFVFGVYSLVEIGLALSNYCFAGASLYYVVSPSVFFFINAVISGVSYKFNPRVIEKIRIYAGVVIAPAAFVLQSAKPSPWWPAYYLVTISSITFLCLTYYRLAYARLLICYFACTAILIEVLLFKIHWTVAVREVGLYFVISTTYYLILRQIINSVSIVIELQKAKDSITKTKEENEQVRRFELLQRLENKDKELTVYSLNFLHKNKLIEDIKNEFYDLKVNKMGDQDRKIDGIARKLEEGFKIDKDWAEFKNYYEGIHKDFFKKLKENYPDLTSTDLKLCALIKLNLNSKEIARILGVLPESIKTGRYRIRKKLKLKQADDLFSFLNTIDAS